MILEVIEDSDVMRATDRLVDRIRQYQQSKMFALEIFILIIIVSILCNIVANLVIGLLTIELAVELIERYLLILISALVTAILLSIFTYLFMRKYFGGALGTFVTYRYRVESKTHKSAMSIVEDVWNKINPLSNWKVPHASAIATTEKRPMFLFFVSSLLKKEKIEKMYNVHLEGEFTYATFPRIWNKFTLSKEIDVPSLGKMTKVESCRTLINLNAERIEKDKFLIGFNATLNLKRPIGPELDELVQDIAVYLRSLKNSLYKSL